MAETLDKQLAVADVYAAALFDLARESNRVEEVRAELEELVKLARIEPSFAAFLSSQALDDDHREAGLERMLRGKLSDVVLNTLLVMNAHGRSGLLAALLRAFALRQAQAAGQVEVRVFSAVELDDATRARIERTVAGVSGRKPISEYVVDPELLGGLVVQVGDVRYDNSVRRQLARARGRLAERSESGFEARLSLSG